MGLKINDLELGDTSGLESIQDGPLDVALSLGVTPAERRALQQMAEHAGSVEEIAAPGGRRVLDTSPNRENLVLLQSHAPTLVDSGWYLWDDLRDDYLGPSHARMQAALKRICGINDARGHATVISEWQTNDFGVTPKTWAGLPAGALGVRKADGTLPTVYLMPVGPNLLKNGDFETDTSEWGTVSGSVLTRDTGVVAVGAASLRVTRGTADTSAISATTNRPAVIPGAYYVLGGRMRKGTSTGGVRVRLSFVDAAGTAVQSTDMSIHTRNEWVEGAVLARAPSHAVAARADLRVQTDGDGYFDALWLRLCVPVAESPATEPAAAGGFGGGGASFDPYPGTDYFAGDVRAFDMNGQTDGTLDASSYVRVRGRCHPFVGHILLDNGMVRLHLQAGYGDAARVRMAVYAADRWRPEFDVYADTGGDSTSRVESIRILVVSRARVVVEATDGDGNVAAYTLRRGIPAVQVDVVRVKDAGSSWLDFESRRATRFTTYHGAAGQAVLRDDVVTGTQSPLGSTLTEPYALQWTPGEPYFTGLVFPLKPSNLTDDGGLLWRESGAATTALRRTFFLLGLAFPWAANGVFFTEAEGAEAEGAGGAVVADAGASGGNVVRLTAQNTGRLVRFRPGVDLPLGDYTLIVRAKDSAQVANDLNLRVYNETDGAVFVEANRTVQAGYAYYTLDFSPGSTTSGDALYVAARKATATANNLDIDYILVVPRGKTSVTPANAIFPRDLARNLLMLTTIRDTVQKA